MEYIWSMGSVVVILRHHRVLWVEPSSAYPFYPCRLAMIPFFLVKLSCRLWLHDADRRTKWNTEHNHDLSPHPISAVDALHVRNQSLRLQLIIRDNLNGAYRCGIGPIGHLRDRRPDRSQVPNSCSAITFLKQQLSVSGVVRCGYAGYAWSMCAFNFYLRREADSE